MVIMIVIKKENRMVIIFKTTQTNVEGSLVIKAPKKEAIIDEKGKRRLLTLS
jgi:hypothetical protein